MNKKFTEVYTTDDVWLSLRIDWDSNEDYYITYLECEDASELQLHSIKCKFLEFSPLNNTLIFVDDFGIKHEIDPVDEHTRDSIRIYSIISYSILEKVSWFEIAIIPFDRNFFTNPWTVVCQAPLSMVFQWQKYWSGLLFPSPGDLSDPQESWFQSLG